MLNLIAMLFAFNRLPLRTRTAIAKGTFTVVTFGDGTF